MDHANSKLDRDRSLGAKTSPSDSFEQFLRNVNAISDEAELLDLACQDLLMRFRNGETVQVERYLESLPSLNSHEAILELLDAEVCCRFDQGRLELEEIVERFPNRESDVRRMAELCGWEQKLENDESHVAPNLEPTDELPEPPEGIRIIGKLPGTRRFRVKRVGQKTSEPTDEVVCRFWDTDINDFLAIQFFDHQQIRSEVWAKQWTQFRHPGWLPIHELGSARQKVYVISRHVEANSLPQTLTSYQKLGRDENEKRLRELMLKIFYTLLAAAEKQLNLANFLPTSIQLDYSGKLQISPVEMAVANSVAQRKIGRSEDEVAFALFCAVKKIIDLARESSQSEALAFWLKAIEKTQKSKPGMAAVQRLADELELFVSKRR